MLLIIKKFFRYSFVGIGNSLFCISIIFFLKNILNYSYWISSSVGYLVGLLITYFINRRFTFYSKNKGIFNFYSFVIGVVICYLISFYISNLFLNLIFVQVFNQTILTNLSLMLGFILYSILMFLYLNFIIFR